MSHQTRSNRPAPTQGVVMIARLVTMACTLLGAAQAAHGQCLQWTDRQVQVPRPSAMPPSWDWRPVFLELVYDSHRHVTVGIGGEGFRSGSIDQALFYLPVSEYNGVQWVSRYDGSAANTPPYRSIGGATFDSIRNVTVIYGGWIGYLGNPQRELWEYDGTTWTHPTPAGAAPPATIYAPMCFDPVHGHTIVLVQKPGAEGSMFQTWEWTGSTWQLGPDMGPTDVSATRMVFDTSRGRAFVYSGSAAGDEETWEYTPGATAVQGVWQKITIPGAPFYSLHGASLVYDPHRHQVLRHAGHGTSIYSYIDATYTWDWGQLRWNLVSSMGNFNYRAGAGIAFDSDRDLVVLHGGIRVYQDTSGVGRTTTYTDTWEYAQNTPGFLAQPSSATVDGGATAVFVASVIGNGASLQWLHDGSPIPGATNPLLAVNNASQASAGLYVLRATNTCGVLDSVAARLTVRPPANDSSLTPSVIYSSSLTGTTLGATPDGTTTCGSSNASPDVWYRYTVPYTGALTMDTCGSDFDTVLSFHACCPGPGAVIACSDDNPPAGCDIRASALSMAVTLGQQFLVRVSGYQGAAGRFTLNTRVVPFNNACASAIPIFAGSYVGSTVGATVDGSASCSASSTTPDIWYRFRSDCSGTLSLDTYGSSYDTVLSVRTGCPGTELACNDDARPDVTFSALTVNLQPGTDYYVRVSGYSGATGSVVLNVSPPSIPGDACTSAIPIGLGQRTFATRCATTASLALPPWCEQAAGAVPFYDLWYRYTAATSGTLEVRLCNTTLNVALAVYGAACPTSPYDAVICSAREDSCGTIPLASIPTLPGQQYLLRVGGYYGLNAALAGSGTIDLTLVAFETGACCSSLGCSLTSAYECSGNFQGEGSACASPPCPVLAGSCCVGAHCTVLDAAHCSAAGGAFGGTGSLCGQSMQNPITCCPANFNGLDGVSLQDIFDFLGAWFAGDPRADINGVNGLEVQDIFAFLSAWFAGC